MNRRGWVEDGDDQLHQIRQEFIQQLSRSSLISAGSDESRVRGLVARSEGDLQEFYILRIPLAHMPPVNDTEVPVFVGEQALAPIIRNIQNFVGEMNSTDYVYRLRFIDVSYTSDGGSAEALFMLTNFRMTEDMSMYLDVPRLNTLSLNQWQIRQWSNFHIDFLPVEVQRASWIQVVAAILISNAARFLGANQGIVFSA